MQITDGGDLIVNIDEKTKLISEKRLKEILKKEEHNSYSPSGLTFEEVDLDPIVEGVREKLLKRSLVGTKKYGTTLSKNNADNYIEHIQMELMDACNYLEKKLQQNLDIKQIVKNTPNNLELGEKIRKIYGS